MRDFLDWIHGRTLLCFTYECLSKDFRHSVVSRVKFFDGSNGSRFDLTCPSRKRDNEKFLRIVRKAVFETGERLVVGHDVKSFMSFIPGVTKRVGKVFDVELLGSATGLHVEQPAAGDPEKLFGIFRQIFGSVTNRQKVVYDRVLEPAIWLYSKIEKVGLPNNRGTRTFSHYKIAGTSSGRLANENLGRGFINPLNISKSDRSCVVAPPGRTLIMSDYNAMEMRVLALVSGDDVLMSVFDGGHDVYAIVAAIVFDTTTITQAQRDDIKTLCFRLVYGGGAFGYAKSTGRTIEEGETVVRKFFAAFPKTEEWILRTQIQIIESAGGSVESIFGRVKPIPTDVSDADVRSAQNFLVQSPANDIVMMAISEMDEELHENSKIIAHIHDCVIVESLESKAKSDSLTIERVMKQPRGLGLFCVNNLPLSPKIVIARSWA